MASTNTMLKQCSGLIDTKDVTPWENEFLQAVWEVSKEGTRPDLLSPKRVEALERIWKKHFAG